MGIIAEHNAEERTDSATTFDPETRYGTPEALLAAADLTETQKAAALHRWRFTVERRLDSGNEGMPTAGTEPRDAELARDIELALKRLEGDS